MNHIHISDFGIPNHKIATDAASRAANLYVEAVEKPHAPDRVG